MRWNWNKKQKYCGLVIYSNSLIKFNAITFALQIADEWKSHKIYFYFCQLSVKWAFLVSCEGETINILHHGNLYLARAIIKTVFEVCGLVQNLRSAHIIISEWLFTRKTMQFYRRIVNVSMNVYIFIFNSKTQPESILLLKISTSSFIFTIEHAILKAFQ